MPKGVFERTLKPVKERLLAKIRVNDETGCWVWTASQNGRGYGQINVDGRPRTAHRVSYEVHKGQIPSGLHVCHHCDNPSCINPEHLFLGTAADNTADMVSKGRQVPPRGIKQPRAVLNDADIISIRSMPHLPQDELGKMFGVSGAQICRIRTRKQWSHVA